MKPLLLQTRVHRFNLYWATLSPMTVTPIWNNRRYTSCRGWTTYQTTSSWAPRKVTSLFSIPACSHIPYCKVAVFLPIHNAADEEGIGVVLRPGHEVGRAVCQGYVGSRHSVVHRGEHGTLLKELAVLVCQQFDEACHRSGMLLLQDIDHLEQRKDFIS